MNASFLSQIPIDQMVTLALKEDIQTGDITAELIPESQTIQATILGREDFVLSGRPWVDAVFEALDGNIQLDWYFKEGASVPKESTVCRVVGPARAVLTGERTALNFMQLLSGVATTTKQFIDVLEGSKTKLLDTRKTIPGLRLAQKYAVLCGGGHNHRIGLFDAFLIKENHIAAVGGIGKAILQARKNHPDKQLEIEVENLSEFSEALEYVPDVIMLDNFSLGDIKKAVEAAAGSVQLEVSGNINLDTLPTYANMGVDFISTGAITKHVRAIDLSMRFEDA